MVVGAKNGFEVSFDCIQQMYFVTKDGKYIANGFKFSEVKCYLD